MNYSDIISYLYEQLPMYQRSGPAAYKDSLDNTWALDKMFQYPHKQFKSIHVAGTNGKGSVSHQLASILQTAGYRVGLYTSPHLKDYRERIKINGAMIPEKSVVDFIQRFWSMNEQVRVEPSFFELTVMMAFDYFAEQQVDFAVIEVGLGGRLDSTNVITPEVAVITNISLDHTNLLGSTVAQIAREKAGIIKPNVPVVIGENDAESAAVFRAKALEKKASVVFADQTYQAVRNSSGDVTISSENQIVARGIQTATNANYQLKNLVTTFAAIQELNKKGVDITSRQFNEGIKETLQNTGLQGRWQTINAHPKVICDTGHNEAGLAMVVQQLKDEVYEHLHIVFGTVNDKNIDALLKMLPKDATYYFTNANIDRSLKAKQLYKQAVRYNLKGDVYPTVIEAYRKALNCAGKNDLVFVGGSTFVVAEIL